MKMALKGTSGEFEVIISFYGNKARNAVKHIEFHFNLTNEVIFLLILH
jgi:hypothetical protein